MSATNAGHDIAELLLHHTEEAVLSSSGVRGDLDEAGLNGILDRAEGLLHAEPEQARRLAETCERLATGPQYAGVRARSAYQRARILAEQGNLDSALRLIEQARTHWRRAGRRVEALRTDLGRMQVLDDLGRHGDAIDVGKELIAALDAVRGEDRHLAQCTRAIAVENLGIAYGLTGQHDRALDAYARAEADYARLAMRAERARPLANRGVELLALGRPREALADLTAATAIFREAGDRLFAAQCQGFTAQAHRQLGELNQALRVLEPARVVLDALGATAESARLQLALAETCHALGLITEAADHARAAVGATRRAGMTHDTGLGCFLVALTDLASGDHAGAARSLQDAIGLFEQVGDRQMLARVRLTQAEVAHGSGRPDEGSRLLTEAIALLRAGGWSIPLAWAYLRQADGAGDYTAAGVSLESAADLVRLLRLPDLSYQFELRMGRQRRRLADDVGAEAHYRRAIAELERSSGVLADHVLLTAFRAERLAAHDDLVDLLVERGSEADIREACQLADDARSRTITDLMTDAVGVGPGFLDGDRDLAEAFADLNATYLALQHAGDALQRADLAERAGRLERKLSALRLRHVGPAEEAGGQAADVRAPTRGSHGQVLAFHVVGTDILVFAIHGGVVAARRLRGVLDRLHGLLDDLSDQWGRILLAPGVGLRNTDVLLRSSEITLAELHALLIAPLTDLLAPGDDLRVVSDGRMGAIPFHALFDGREYLNERWALTVAPTLDAALSMDTAIDLAEPALVVAIADSSAPAVEEEARIVADLLPSATVLSGAAATCDAFAAAAAGSRVIHLACHGVFSPGNPLFSRLRLGDRWLTTAEIVRLDLDGALVILSACESGAHGRMVEPVGLGWAFLAAGAAGVFVSQWAVHDDAALSMMAALYRELAAGHTASHAVRRARLSVAEQYPHPCFWAPFSYLASPRPSAARRRTRSGSLATTASNASPAA